MRARSRSWIAPLIVSGLLGACASVGPDYAPPALPADLSTRPAAAFDAAGADGLSSAALPARWWELYADPRLDALIDEALRANTDLRAAAANLEKAQAVVQEVRATDGVRPSINASTSLLRNSTLGVGAADHAHGVVDAGVGVSYEIDVVGRIRRSIEVATASEQARAAAYDLARITVVANVVGAYTDACAAGARLAVARQSVELQRQSLALTTRGVRAGITAPIGEVRSRALLAQLSSAVPPLEGSRRAALYGLAVLTGHAPADFPPELAQCASIPRIAQPLPVGDGTALIRRRPDIRQAERELASATAAIGVQTAALYPTVSLGASVGTTFRMGGEPLGGSAFHYSLGPLISWTFPNRQVAQARIDEAGADARAALAKFDGVVLASLKEAESALTAYAQHIEENRQLREARDRSREALDMQRRLASGGTVSNLETLDVERTLATAESALAASDSTLATDRVRIFLALGGGWEALGPAPEPAR
ncbi:MAG: TolC family protein [Burkholderiaceae bacterium]